MSRQELVAGAQPRVPLEDWETVLDRLEVEVLWAERLLRAAKPLDPSGWTPPRAIGPMPEHLLERAREIHARQLETVGKLVDAMRRSTQQRVYVSTALEVSPERPRFIDVAS